MFDRLQDRFQQVFKTLRGLGKIRESNIREVLAEVRSSLLEADVQYRVAQSFVDSVRDTALGTQVLESVNPDQQFVKILYDEMVRILGGSTFELPRVSGRPLVILVAGLQGSGKTTTAAKLAMHLRDHRQERPLLVPADTRRPAAREQLEQLGRENGLQVFSSRDNDAVKVCKAALEAVNRREIAAGAIVVDTAGRLHVDDETMQELDSIRAAVKPDVVLYVLDAMVGQDAVRAAEVFSSRIGFDGLIVTKLDGDARGGAALSVRMATGKPIYFLGTGEKLDALEPLHPERLASRILGMGDVVSLVEKAQGAVDAEQAERLAHKLSKNDFTIEDFAEQMTALKKMGSLESIVGMLPGGAQIKKMMGDGLPEKEMARIDAIIKSMTPRERRNPKLLDGSRRKRIADGSGTDVPDVNRFIKQFLQAKKMMSSFGRMGPRGLARGMFR